MSITVRDANEGDMQLLASMFSALNREAGMYGYPKGSDAARLHAQVTPDVFGRRWQAVSAWERLFVAEEDGSPLGFVALRLLPQLDQDVPFAEVTQLFVASEHRRGGVAQALVAHAEALAQEAGCTAVHIITGAHNNESAHRLYHTQGYEPADVVFEKYFVGGSE